MKRIAFTATFFCLFSLMATANNEINAKSEDPGDPKKKKETPPSFALTEGYFSFFNFFDLLDEKADTMKFVPSAVPVSKPQQLEK